MPKSVRDIRAFRIEPWSDFAAVVNTLPLDSATGIPYIGAMRTAIETPTFERQADTYWTEDQRLDFLT